VPVVYKGTNKQVKGRGRLVGPSVRRPRPRPAARCRWWLLAPMDGPRRLSAASSAAITRCSAAVKARNTDAGCPASYQGLPIVPFSA